MNNKLIDYKPCPICNKLSIRVNGFINMLNSGKAEYHLECANCEYRTTNQSTYDLALYEWNNSDINTLKNEALTAKCKYCGNLYEVKYDERNVDDVYDPHFPRLHSTHIEKGYIICCSKCHSYGISGKRFKTKWQAILYANRL